MKGMAPTGDTLTKPTTRSKTATPPMYRVLLLNDDYTPMDFVVEILKRYFRKSELEAVQIMLNVHQQGSGVCGVYTHEIAETKINQVKGAARSAGYPLRCIMEPE